MRNKGLFQDAWLVVVPPSLLQTLAPHTQTAMVMTVKGTAITKYTQIHPLIFQLPSSWSKLKKLMLNNVLTKVAGKKVKVTMLMIRMAFVSCWLTTLKARLISFRRRASLLTERCMRFERSWRVASRSDI